MKRALLVSYTFPPVGGAGVQRVAKFAKYLPPAGWAVSVLTASNPSVPLFDESLCADVPADTIIEAAPTWEPSYALKANVTAAAADGHRRSVSTRIKSAARAMANLLLQPDPQILWAPSAIRRGKRLLNRLPHDCVIASGPPYSSFVIGEQLSRIGRLPLVLDYRDEWDISNSHWENRGLSRWAARYQDRLQNRILRSAQAVLATTHLSSTRLAERAQRAGAELTVQPIYNGFDPDDFLTASRAAPQPEKFRITYTGTLWKLTSIEPLVAAIERLDVVSPSAAERIELVVAGRRTREQDAVLERLVGTRASLVRHDYLDHRAAIELMRNSDLLCVLLSDTPDAARVVPAKLFEYMACQRPLLAIGPVGEMWDLLAGNCLASTFQPTDIQGIAQRLQATLNGQTATADATHDHRWQQFSRRHQAQQLASVLDGLQSFELQTSRLPPTRELEHCH